MNITASDRIAFAEVDEILKILDERLVNKIPQSVRRIYKNNRDLEYKVNLNIDKSIKQQNLSRKGMIYLSELYLKYWCPIDKRKVLLDVFAKNDERLKKRLEKENNLEYVLRLKEQERSEVIIKENKNLETNICKYEKKNFFERIIEKIKQILKK